MYVPTNYQINNANEIEVFVSNLNERHPTWSDLITIDYFYHHHMPDYDGGLSFLDRINKKLGEFHPEWNIADLKNGIRHAQYPVSVYADIIAYMLASQLDIHAYGI
jgi:hypothetical protein